MLRMDSEDCQAGKGYLKQLRMCKPRQIVCGRDGIHAVTERSSRCYWEDRLL